MTCRALGLVVLIALTSCATQDEHLPRVGYPHPYKGRYLTAGEIDEIATFAQTIEGISHHLLVISVTSPTEVEVESGRSISVQSVEWHDTVRLKKVHGRWKVFQKDRVKVIPMGS